MVHTYISAVLINQLFTKITILSWNNVHIFILKSLISIVDYAADGIILIVILNIFYKTFVEECRRRLNLIQVIAIIIRNEAIDFMSDLIHQKVDIFAFSLIVLAFNELVDYKVFEKYYHRYSVSQVHWSILFLKDYIISPYHRNII